MIQCWITFNRHVRTASERIAPPLQIGDGNLIVALTLENERGVLERLERQRAVDAIVAIEIRFLVGKLALGHAHQAER